MARLFRQMLFLVLFAAVPASLAAILHPKRPQWHRAQPTGEEIDLRTAQNLSEQILWVDARPRTDFEQAHIPGALLLNSEEWEGLLDPFLDQWKPGQTVVVYCSSSECERSKEVAERLHTEVQIPKVYVLKGGWKAWTQK